jgi:hypothetical protein
MKAIFVHLGIMMTLLSVIYGLWQQYEYTYLIMKSIQVFFYWMVGSYLFQIILRAILPAPEPEPPEPVEQEQPVDAEEKTE